MKKFSSIVSILVLLTGLASTRASSKTSCPVVLELKLSSDRIVAGEPVLLTFVLTNRADDRINLDLGIDQTAWLNLRVVNASGYLVDRTPPPPQRASTLYMSPPRFLRGSETWEKTIVVTKNWSIPRSGSYRVAVDVNVPCSLGSEAPAPIEPLTSRQSLDLHVSGASAIALRRTAQRLADEALQLKNPHEGELPISELMSMPDYIIEPILRRFVFNLGFNDPRRRHILSELSRLNTTSLLQLDKELTQQENLTRLEQIRREHEEAMRTVNGSNP